MEELAKKQGLKPNIQLFTEENRYLEKKYCGCRKPNLDFINSQGKSTLEIHSKKHGNLDMNQYYKKAKNFLEANPTNSTQSFISNEGTYFKYDTITNEFGIINRYGGISTYFEPEDGLKYWIEQVKKYAPKLEESK